MNEVKNQEKEISTALIIFKFLLYIIIIVILLFLYYIFIEFGINPFITIIIFIFTLALFIGPFYKKNQKSIYSRMFPDKKERKQAQREKFLRDKRKNINDNKESIITETRSINLNTKYHKPLLIKCDNCGFLMANIAKKCPKCNKLVKG